MKAQLCSFRRNNKEKAEEGIAFLDIFNFYRINFIIDSKGEKLPDAPFTYTLLSGPMCHIDSDSEPRTPI